MDHSDAVLINFDGASQITLDNILEDENGKNATKEDRWRGAVCGWN